MKVVAEPLPPIAYAPAPPQPRAWRTSLLLVLFLAFGGLALRVLQSVPLPQLRSFLVVSAAVLLEAVPFVVFGAVVSAAIETFVPNRIFERLARLPRPLQMPLAGLAGFAMPLCDCGAVPVARRLMAKRLAPAAVVTFMLSAPLVNPVVLLSTAVAYRGRDVMWPMLVARPALALTVAMTVGWVIGARTNKQLLKVRPDDAAAAEDHCGACDGCGSGGHCSAEPGRRSRAAVFFTQVASDFATLGKYLVIGAIAAGVMKTFIPQSILASVAGTPVLNMVSLMGLGALLSLCSSSDAFVAASFVQFGAAPQLAFLVFPSMIDTKLGFLYRGTFGEGFARTVVIVAGAATIAGALWMEVLFG
jgi:uncharacterized membrane protein YraQ (UPF0718 family)